MRHRTKLGSIFGYAADFKVMNVIGRARIAATYASATAQRASAAAATTGYSHPAKAAALRIALRRDQTRSEPASTSGGGRGPAVLLQPAAALPRA